MSDITTPTDAAEVIAVAREAAAVQEVDPTKDFVVVDTRGEAKILDLEKLLAEPVRPRGTYHPADVASLIGYVEVHKDDAATTVWVHPTEGRVLVVFDDNGAKENGWREHKAELTLQHSPEWKLWAGKDGQLMPQTAFAEHLREGLPDIYTPDGATLLEIATTFEAKTNVHFRSAVDMSSGEAKFAYDESVDAKATTADGTVAVPREFELVLAPFLGEEAEQITANLRHDTRSGKLMIGYKLERPERVIEAALTKIHERLDDRFKRVYRGTPA